MLYRPHWGNAIALLAISTPFVGCGIAGICATAGDGFGAVAFPAIWTAFSLFMSFAGFDLVYRHFIVDEQQLVRNASLGASRVCLRWEDVQSWLVWPSDGSPAASVAWKLMFPDEAESIRAEFENRSVLLRLRDRRAPFFINDWEVSIPSADEFVKELRHFAGEREVRVAGGADSSLVTEPSDSSDAIQTRSPAAIQTPRRK